jgi:hypothetical protein
MLSIQGDRIMKDDTLRDDNNSPCRADLRRRRLPAHFTEITPNCSSPPCAYAYPRVGSFMTLLSFYDISWQSSASNSISSTNPKRQHQININNNSQHISSISSSTRRRPPQNHKFDQTQGANSESGSCSHIYVEKSCLNCDLSCCLPDLEL